MTERRAAYITNRPLEHDHQALLFQWAAWQEKSIPEIGLLFAIPNGAGVRHFVGSNGKRFSPEGQKLKREGLKSGVPDICLPVARRGFHGLYIEMKRPGEKPRQEQIEWLEALQAQGYMATVCDGFDDARTAILDYLGVHSNIQVVG